MTKAKYPIDHAPSAEFLERLKAVQDPDYIVTDLKLIQLYRNMWKAQWMQGMTGKRFKMEMNVGGHETTLAAIEERVLRALKVDGVI